MRKLMNQKTEIKWWNHAWTHTTNFGKKNISPEGYTAWMTRRVRAVMGTLGLESSDNLD